MSALATSGTVAMCLAVAALAGLYLSRRLPDHHLSLELKDTIKLATAVVGTLSALALGFLIASAKTTFDNADNELRTSVAHIILLDRVMRQYGPETSPARAELAKIVKSRLDEHWGGHVSVQASTPNDGDFGIEPVQAALRSLEPQSEVQTILKTRALEVSGVIAEAHWLLAERGNERLPTAFLIILVFWLSLLFLTFGLLAPKNGTVIGIVIICGFSVAGAVFLVIDMAHPYQGIVHLSDEPLRIAMERIGRS